MEVGKETEECWGFPRKLLILFTHLTCRKSGFFQFIPPSKLPWGSPVLARGKPSFLTPSFMHQENRKHIFNVGFLLVSPTFLFLESGSFLISLFYCAGRYSCLLSTFRWRFPRSLLYNGYDVSFINVLYL